MISIPGKIPIQIYPFFWVVVALIGWMSTASVLGTLIWAVVIFISILIHEYGHALTALLFGQTATIDLVGFGGVTRRSGAPLKPWQNFLVVLNGPLAGLLLYVLTLKLAPWISRKQEILSYGLIVAKQVNLIWSLFNLLPMLPLDGGHLLSIALEKAFGFKGTKVALIISMVLAFAIALFFLIGQNIIMAVLCSMFGFESLHRWREVKHLTSEDTSTSLQQLLKEAQEDMQAKRDQEALSKLLLLQEQAKSGALYIIATQLIAHLLADSGQFRQAYTTLLPIKRQLNAEYLHLLQQLAYRLQEWEVALEAGQMAYQKDPQLNTALINAFTSAIMGRAKPTVGWLRSAIHLGLQDPNEVIKKREFDAVRHSAEFQALLRNPPFESRS